MNCHEIQEMILLHFGHELPNEVRDHLERCPDCRTFFEELAAEEEQLGTDELFYPDDEQVERMATQIEVLISSSDSEKSGFEKPQRGIWRRYLPVAAAAVLVLGLIWGAYQSGIRFFSAPGDSSTVDSIAWVSQNGGEKTELDENTIEALLYDFTTQNSYEASEWLLDDLTEEELQYLENNFDVRDLL